MAQYEYRCSSCRRLFATTNPADSATCPDCQSASPRRWAFTAQPMFREHWNHAVGQYVNNRSEMTDALHRKSDEVSEYLGHEHDFQYLTPAEHADPSSYGISPDTIDRLEQEHADR